MAMHLEFVVLGPPISNQQSTAVGRANLAAWRVTVAGEATLRWPNPVLVEDLKAIIINFYTGKKPSLDVDNISKPILDVMQAIIYDDDRQIRQAEFTHAELGAVYKIAGTSKILATAIQANQQFVYVRIEDPVVPFPLPT
jgi:Holliday junction resolvase RusA-like endonuclease